MKNVDPKLEFLMGSRFENFFEASCAIPGNTDFRCKGCGEILPQWKREEHFKEHKNNISMFREAARVAANIAREQGTGEIRVDVCTQCGSTFEQERKRGRPRKKCFDCLPEGEK